MLMGEVMSLDTYLTTLGTIITKVFSWVVDALGVITGNPILLVPFGVIAVFTVIKVLKKIF
jgi:hypothetical protein